MPLRGRQLHRSADDIVEVHPLGGPVLSNSREVLEPPHRIGTLKRELLDHAGLLQDAVARNAVLVEIALNQLAVHQDAVEEVVEIMGHTGCHLADRLETSGHDELILSAPQAVVRAL